MNRIILIGNGFDLAHNLETSYRNFLEWFKNNEMTRDPDSYFKHIALSESSLRWRTSEVRPALFFEHHYNNKYTNLDDFIADGTQCRFIYKDKFIETLLKKTTLQTWVDIEEEYYFALNRCLNNEKGEAIEKLNSSFNLVQKALEKYLVGVMQASNDKTLNPILLKTNNIITGVDSIKPDKDDNVLFLNFNYTSTEARYIAAYAEHRKKMPTSIHIHGELENSDNPIVFGYGDEIDERYKHIENENKKEYLENVKSIRYLHANSYKKLLAFIDSNEYQIYIMGHSCGISDRTLLNTLFEHENCKSIEAFYHQINENADNFTDLIINISRNFINKPLMRKIVTDKTMCVPLNVLTSGEKCNEPRKYLKKC